MEAWDRRLAGTKPADITSRTLWTADFPTVRPTGLSMDNQRHGSSTLPRPPIGQTWKTRYRNINLLAIAYACRPRLRSRLTLSRLTLLRKPWAFGGGVSHSSFVTHTGILTSGASTARLPRPLHCRRNAPLPLHSKMKSTASENGLSPVTLSAHGHLTSELLRTLLMYGCF